MDEKELPAKAKKFKKNLHSHYKHSDYPEYSPAKYGLVPTTPNEVLKDELEDDLLMPTTLCKVVTTLNKVLKDDTVKDDIVTDDVVKDQINDKDETN